MEDVSLKDTTEMMLSNDYKERFRGEYHQLRIRVSRLERLLDCYEEGAFTCPYDLLHEQLVYMRGYLTVLESRAVLENIEL